MNPINANLFRMFFVKLPQNRHPERSASQRLIACHSACGAEPKDLGGAYFTHAVRSFSTTEARQQDLVRYALDGHGYIFSCTVIIFHPQVCARSLNSGLIVRMRFQGRTVAGPPGAGSVVEKLRTAWVR
jgi:hypothetical protein